MKRCCIDLQTEIGKIWDHYNELDNKNIVSLADSPYLVIPAYVIGFLLPALLYLFDFISGKWKTIKTTFMWGIFHIVVTICSMILIYFYAHVQMSNRDYKEMMTAIVTVLIGCFHLCRSVWGLLQLNAYNSWCYEALECSHAVGNALPSEKKVNEVVKSASSMVNNSLIDNEFSGKDIGVKVNRNLKLWTSQPEICLARWAVAFLCSHGDNWINPELPSETNLPSLIDQTKSSLKRIAEVTFSVSQDETLGKKESGTSLFSIRQRISEYASIELLNGAYSCNIKPCFSLLGNSNFLRSQIMFSK